MEQEILLNQPTDGGSLLNFDLSFLQTFLTNVGDNPLQVMAWLFIHGGWIVFVVMLLFLLRALFVSSKVAKASAKKRYTLLAVDVPRASEQTVRAVENMFAHLAGAHSPSSFMEKWFEGKTQDPISVEIISIDGHVQFLIRCISSLRDLVEASLYAQYPDSEITEVLDYALNVPTKFPDATYELFGTEMIPVNNDVYPLKTYRDFEHVLTSEFKDPLAVLLEAFSRLGPGEQAWYQIIMVPIDQKDFKAKAMKEIQKLKGDKPPEKNTMLDKALDIPINLLSVAGEVLFSSGEPTVKKKDDKQQSRMLTLTPGEREVIEAVETKMSKLQYLCKIRFLYIAKKEVFQKSKIVQSFIGSIKQFNTNNLQALKPEGKKVGVNGTLLFFKDRRNNRRKERLINAYRSRSDWAGMNAFFMGVDELATLWHLPEIKFVKAPQLKKTEAKKAEPPINLPFG